MRKSIGFIALLVVFALFYGCGYHIAGRGGRIEGVESLAVPVFRNLTQKPDIESIMTTAVVDEFINIVDITTEGNADAVLRGVIKSYRLRPVSYSERDVVNEYRLTVVFAFELIGTGDGRVLWKNDMLDYEDFQVDTASVTETKAKEIEAFRKIARDTARLLRERILEEVAH